GVFPVTYIYLAYVMKKFNPILWILMTVTGVISISNGLFFYFSPVRNVFDRSGDHFAHLPFGQYFFIQIAILVIGILAMTIIFNSYKNSLHSHTK
ncbi:MAG: hypothetical protein AAB874_00085, partial [Patescibacteria group bacterium]